MATGGMPTIRGLPTDIWQDESLSRKFRFDEELGRGGMAVVVAAHHTELDERVAIKFLLPEAARSNAAVARFRREAQAAAKIKNEHVVRIIDVCMTHLAIPYIVMEYLDGSDLDRLLRKNGGNQLGVSDAVDFILQASEALAEGHRLGIVHRDLKPANLFCVERGHRFPMIKVLDFGISKINPKLGEVERTDQHEILGSPRYMSPEQIGSSRDVDHRADIWSIGVVLYESLTGQVPFLGDVVPELWRKIRSDAPQPLTQLRSEVPAALSDVVMKCLEKEPSQRYSSLGELARALAPFAPERSQGSLTRIRWMFEAQADGPRRSTEASHFSDGILSSRLRFNRASFAAVLSVILGFLCWAVLRSLASSVESPNLSSNINNSASAAWWSHSGVPNVFVAPAGQAKLRYFEVETRSIDSGIAPARRIAPRAPSRREGTHAPGVIPQASSAKTLSVAHAESAPGASASSVPLPPQASVSEDINPAPSAWKHDIMTAW